MARDAWEHVIPFMAYEPEVRRVIYTTDESVKRQPHRILLVSRAAGLPVDDEPRQR